MRIYRYLTEAEMLDVSIKSADKELKTTAKKRAFLDNHCFITAKTDGVKLTILKISDDGDLSDWIFAYKGNILYPGEFDWQPDIEINTKSIGASQFKKVFDHFNTIGKNNIPVGTELQCEFLMRKNTLSSNYKRPHGIILIQHAKSTFNERAAKFGVLKTIPRNEGTDKREKYAKELAINAPLILFDGSMKDERSFLSGIKYAPLKASYDNVRGSIDFDDTDSAYEQLKQVFLGVESQFGGKEEGVVVTFDDGKTYKWQQSYQLDQEARKAIKAKTREDTEEAENAYWDKVKDAAEEVSRNVSPLLPLNDALKILSEQMRKYKPQFKHSKKTESQIKDDIQLTAKTIIKKRMRGNNGCLVMGKFRLLTNGHKKLVESALKEFDMVCICLVTSKETAKNLELRLTALQKVFGNNPRVEIVQANSGNIIRNLEKASFNINAIYTGTDRIPEYTEQLKKQLGMELKEVKRTEADISATRVIANIDNKEFFEANTPQPIHSLYDKYLEAYGQE